MIGPTHRIPPALWHRMSWSARARFIDDALLADLKAQPSDENRRNLDGARNRRAVAAYLARYPDATNKQISEATRIPKGSMSGLVKEAKAAA